MLRVLSSLVMSLAITAVALAGAPDEAKVQGNYEGTWLDDTAATGKAEAKCFAEGGGKFRLLLTRHLGDGKKAEAKLQGQTKGGQVTFGGNGWEAAYADGVIKGKQPKAQELAITLTRVERKPPGLGAKPPQGAIVLFDGKSLDQWIGRKNQPPRWKILGDGTVEVRGGSIHTKQRFGSCRLHIEFRCNFRPDKRSQGRGNSGVFLPNGDEIQVLDSFVNETYPGGGCGGIYRYKKPDVPAALPPLEWQTFDIEYHAPRVEGGKLVAKGRVSIVHNGIRIHDNVELRRTRPTGPIQIQDHGNPLHYRNMWLVPIEEK